MIKTTDPTMAKRSVSGIRLRSSLALLLAAFFWGTTFVAQSIAMAYIGPYTYNACRFLLGCLVLFLVSSLWNKYKTESPQTEGLSFSRKTLWLGGLFCGLCLFFAGSFQQVGIQYTTAGKAGFVTTLYIILVPLFGLFLKRHCSFWIVPAVVLAVCGFYLLCIKEGFSINKGDAIVLASSIVFALHIMTVDHFSPRTNPLQLSCIQFLVAGVLSLIPALLLEAPSFSGIVSGWKQIVYAGVFSCCIAYTMQIVGQRGLHPAAASLIMSLESVISVLAGWIILGDALNQREILGCILVFCAVLLAQLPSPSHTHVDADV